MTGRFSGRALAVPALLTEHRRDGQAALADDVHMLGLAALEMLTGEVPSKNGYTLAEIKQKLKHNSQVLDEDARAYVKELASRKADMSPEDQTEYQKAREENQAQVERFLAFCFEHREGAAPPALTLLKCEFLSDTPPEALRGLDKDGGLKFMKGGV